MREIIFTYSSTTHTFYFVKITYGVRQSGSLKSLFINSILFSKLDKPYFLCKRTTFEILKRLLHYSHAYTTYFTKAIKMWCHWLCFSATACGDSPKSRRIHANACYHHHAYTAEKGRGFRTAAGLTSRGQSLTFGILTLAPVPWPLESWNSTVLFPPSIYGQNANVAASK